MHFNITIRVSTLIREEVKFTCLLFVNSLMHLPKSLNLSQRRLYGHRYTDTTIITELTLERRIRVLGGRFAHGLKFPDVHFCLQWSRIESFNHIDRCSCISCECQ